MKNNIKGNLINIINPRNFGIVEIDLSENILDYLWKISNKAKNKKISHKNKLAGNISNSYCVEDENNYFYNEVLKPALNTYGKFHNENHPILQFPYAIDCFVDNTIKDFKFKLDGFWVNYQNKHEFNPNHNHSGVYSFVIWLKIPYDYEDQCKLPQFKETKKCDLKPGCFQFTYYDILGTSRKKTYSLNKEEHEGKMIIFPSLLSHEVFPFYDIDEQRVSMSGNIYLSKG
tara:strand:+ start:60 stop:749 length:690 start_codon:yes stop_codon:yes gene_type:complete